MLYCFKKALAAREACTAWLVINVPTIEQKIGQPYVLPWHCQHSEASALREGKAERHHLTLKALLQGIRSRVDLKEPNEFFCSVEQASPERTEGRHAALRALANGRHLIGVRLSLETLEEKMQRRARRDVDFKTSSPAE